MGKSLSNSAPRGIVLAVALLVLAFLSYFSIRNALAVYDLGLQSRQGYERATKLEPGDFRNWHLLGRYWQYNLEEPDTSRAIRAYAVALSLNPRSADAWLDLGTAQELAGNVSAARDAFLHAKRSYPLSAEASWRYANFLLRQGELDAAFREMRQTAEAEPQRGAEVLSRALRAQPNIDLVIDRVLPPVADAYLGALADQIAERQTANGLKIWNRLAALHPRLALSHSYALVDALARQSQVAEAQRVWEQAVNFAGFADLFLLPGSILWDGGFESGVNGAGFAWNFPDWMRGVQGSFDTREKHSGNRSFRLLFNGKYNLNLSGPCHSVPVQPSTAYKFSAWVRTLSISTEEGVRFQLHSLNTADPSTVYTADVHGSRPWTRVELPWSSGKDVRLMQVCVVRLPSREADNKIKGMAWIDDVALVPVTAEPPKP